MDHQPQTKQISLFTYFRREKKLLILTAITGLIYNIGLAAGPLLEGQLAQYLYDILKGRRAGRDILLLSLVYTAVIALVQGARALKRLYVRKFANHVSRSMKESIYHHLVHESYAQAQQEDAGAIMTRAIADAEACAEGMRKFTTEIYDTGVVMIAYLVTLFLLDWRLTLLVILFPPVAYLASAALKKKVSVTSSESKIAMSRLNNAAVDYAGHALTYRIFGEDRSRSAAYEEVLDHYEKKNVAAGIWQNSPQPVYLVISMIGVIPILYYGGRNVLGTGWIVWTIASFSSFLSCFTKLATKSSHAAKLFNAVQKAQVSWERIKGYLTEDAAAEITPGADTGDTPVPAILPPADAPAAAAASAAGSAAGPSRRLVMAHVNFSYEDGSFSLHDLNLTASPGQIIGITGQVASGKSTFGKIFLNEYPFEGTITYGGRSITDPDTAARGIFAYAGHDPELFTGSIRDNITFGQVDNARLQQVLREVQIDVEVDLDEDAGTEGTELSGGQQARIALARALYSKAPVLILDDPFSAVDADTEEKIFRALRTSEQNRIILLLSHRLAMFPRMDQIVFLENGTMTSGTQEEMLHNPAYAALYRLQTAGVSSAGLQQDSAVPGSRKEGSHHA